MIIGIAGKKQCGKDTICNIIRYLDWMKRSESMEGLVPSAAHFQAVMDNSDVAPILSIWEKHAWADKLKQCASIILGADVDCFEEEWFKSTFTTLPLSNEEGEPMTNREFLQYFGTEVGRAIGKNLWVDSLMQDYHKQFSQIPEYGISAEGYRIPISINVVEPCWIISDTRFPNEADRILDKKGVLIKVERETGLDDNHPSEHALDDYKKFTYVINNNGTLQELIDQVIVIMSEIEGSASV